MNALLLVASIGLAQPPPAEAPIAATPAGEPVATSDGKRFSWVALPVASYDVDDGFGAGARAVFDWYAPGYDPYRLSLVFHAFATTDGFHHHRFRFDAPGLGPNGRYRLTGHFAYRQWLNDGYWGIGNHIPASAESLASTAEADLTRYRYTLQQPFSRILLRGELGGPWAWFGFTVLRWSWIRAYEGSLLEEESPLGMEGGPGVQVGGGLLYDTREPEITPDGGVLYEVAVRAAPPLPGSEALWFGAFASARGFVHVGPKVVFGSRVMAEWMWGDIPFYDMVTWGGLNPTMGFGGADTLRGVAYGRWRAPHKATWNNELRVDVGSHTLFDRELRWQIVPFFDAGLVWGAGDDASEAFPIHPTLGLGIHPIVAETMVGRFDFALGSDEVVEADGTLTYVPSLGVYIVFDHTF